MNKMILHALAFEVTRNCNIRCAHCMRGEAQNINMKRSVIDDFFDKEKNNFVFSKIYDIIFTGGEPTLNPNLIIYAINKIIVNEIPVKHISMVTNGQIFVPKLVEAFNKFNVYRNLKLREELVTGDEYERGEIAYKMYKDYNAQISFSTDRFHQPILDETRELYKAKAIGLDIDDKELDEDKMLKIGRSTIGVELEPKEITYNSFKGPGYFDDFIEIFSHVYITAKGDINYGGDGSYDMIDSNAKGKIKSLSLFNSIGEHGIIKKN